jgi:hypothetical protein
VISIVDHKECRCRGEFGCQKISCKANGDYSIASYSSDSTKCEGSPVTTQKITSGAEIDAVKFGQCQMSLGATPFSGER